jgi:hypothetical protein
MLALMQKKHMAQVAAEDVARLRGQLRDLDNKYKLQVEHASGSLDGRALVPWQHVGPGTRAADPHPESFARPWDPPDVELTFQPVISTVSKKIMREARGESSGGGFLDRLGNDMRRREAKLKVGKGRLKQACTACRLQMGECLWRCTKCYTVVGRSGHNGQ